MHTTTQFVTAFLEFSEANVSAVKHLCVDVLEGGKLCEHLPRERDGPGQGSIRGDALAASVLTSVCAQVRYSAVLC